MLHERANVSAFGEAINLIRFQRILCRAERQSQKIGLLAPTRGKKRELLPFIVELADVSMANRVFQVMLKGGSSACLAERWHCTDVIAAIAICRQCALCSLFTSFLLGAALPWRMLMH
jgi:hypothetical protein